MRIYYQLLAYFPGTYIQPSSAVAEWDFLGSFFMAALASLIKD